MGVGDWYKNEMNLYQQKHKNGLPPSKDYFKVADPFASYAQFFESKDDPDWLVAYISMKSISEDIFKSNNKKEETPLEGLWKYTHGQNQGIEKQKIRKGWEEILKGIGYTEEEIKGSIDSYVETSWNDIKESEDYKQFQYTVVNDYMKENNIKKKDIAKGVLGYLSKNREKIPEYMENLKKTIENEMKEGKS